LPEVIAAAWVVGLEWRCPARFGCSACSALLELRGPISAILLQSLLSLAERSG